jgi:hypothetical protein
LTAYPLEEDLLITTTADRSIDGVSTVREFGSLLVSSTAEDRSIASTAATAATVGDRSIDGNSRR